MYIIVAITYIITAPASWTTCFHRHGERTRWATRLAECSYIMALSHKWHQTGCRNAETCNGLCKSNKPNRMV